MISEKTSVRLITFLMCMCAIQVIRVKSQPPLPGDLEAQTLQDFGTDFFINAYSIQSQYVNSQAFSRSSMSRFWPFFVVVIIVMLLPRSSSSASSSSDTSTTCTQAPTAASFGLPCCTAFTTVGTCPADPGCTFTTSCIYNCANIVTSEAACLSTNQCQFLFGTCTA